MLGLIWHRSGFNEAGALMAPEITELENLHKMKFCFNEAGALMAPEIVHVIGGQKPEFMLQ